MKELEELLDLEFIEYKPEDMDGDEHWITDDKASIIYYALKHYLTHLTNTGASMVRITHTVELANDFKEYAKRYLTMLIEDLKKSNLLEQDNIQDIDNKLKEELES